MKLYWSAPPSESDADARSSGVIVGELYPSGGHCAFTCGNVAAAAVTASTAPPAATVPAGAARGAVEAEVTGDAAAGAAGLAAVAVTVRRAPAFADSAFTPAPVSGTVTQPPGALAPQPGADSRPDQRPTFCPAASLTLTVAVDGHPPAHDSSTRSATDVTLVPFTPVPARGANVAVPGPAAAGDSSRV